jgi:hypothetical protein
MSEKIMKTANQAIFHLQLNTDDAIRYVIKNANVSPKEAGIAIKETLVGYKTR